MTEQSSREYRKRMLRGDKISGEEDPEEEERDLLRRSKKQKKTRRIILLTILIVIAAAGVSLYLFQRFFQYPGYEVSWEKDLNQGSLTGYEPFLKGLLKYSKDGVTFLSDKGQESWVESYEMKAPIISVNGNFAAIADQQGNKLIIFGEDGKTGEATTLLPITKAAVSGTGVSAVIEEDTSGSYIAFFNKDGSALDITIKAKLSGQTGYPTDLALSPDGSRLMVCYEYIDGQAMKGRVVFYDFSEIGKNIPNRLVGGFDEQFSKSLLAKVSYFSPVYSYAAADTGLYFFSSKNLASPALIKEVPEEDEIQTIFNSGEYAGVILKSASSRYRLEVYRANGSPVLKKEFDEPYQYAGIDGEYVFIYSTDHCLIYNLSGTEKFNGSLDFSVRKIIKGTLPGEFIMAGPTTMKGIRLK